MDSGADVCMSNAEDTSIYLNQMESTSDNIMQVYEARIAYAPVCHGIPLRSFFTEILAIQVVVPDQIIGDGRDYYVVIDDSHMNGQGVNGVSFSRSNTTL